MDRFVDGSSAVALARVRGGPDRVGDDRLDPGWSGCADDFSTDEFSSEEDLLEFLAADFDPVPADPIFRERLKEQLWELVELGALERNDH